VLLQPHEYTKLEPKAQLCCFLGYGIEHEGYRWWDPISKCVRVSYHVVFWKNKMFSALFDFHISSPMTQFFTNSLCDLFLDDGQNNDAQTGDGSLDSTEPIAAESSLPQSYADRPTNDLLRLFEIRSNNATSSTPPIETSSTNFELWRSERVRQLPDYLRDYQLYAAVASLYEPSTY